MRLVSSYCNVLVSLLCVLLTTPSHTGIDSLDKLDRGDFLPGPEDCMLRGMPAGTLHGFLLGPVNLGHVPEITSGCWLRQADGRLRIWIVDSDQPLTPPPEAEDIMIIESEHPSSGDAQDAPLPAGRRVS